MIVTLAGHVDHGKSALVHALTGARTDRLAEERRRGLSLDLGFAYTELAGERVGFVDVPGHHRFIHNMVAGVAGDQFALLVVAADDGVMPQTKEHLDILRILALQHGCIALTKCDLVDAERRTAVQQQLRELCQGTFLADAPIFPCSALDAATLADLRTHLGTAASGAAESANDAPFRLAIDRAFSLTGAGCVVTGTVHGGQLTTNDQLLLGTAGKSVRVREIRVQDQSAKHAVQSDRAAINLAGIDAADVTRGDWLTAPAAHNASNTLVVEFEALPGVSINHWRNVHVHLATAHRLGRFARLDDSTGSGLVELILEEPVQAKHGDRVVVRDYARQATLGGGPVRFAGRPVRRRRHPARLARLAAFASDNPQQALAELLQIGPVALHDWRATYLLTDEQAAVAIKHHSLQALPQADELFATPNQLAEARKAVLATVQAAPATDPPGLTLAAIAQAVAIDKPLIDAAAALLVREKVLTNVRGRYTPAAAKVELSPNLAALLKRCTPLIDAPHPASIGDLSKQLNLPLGPLGKALVQLAKARRGCSARSLPGWQERGAR